MALEDHAVPSRIESSAVGNTRRHSEGTHKEHHNLQADALQCLPDNSLTRYTESQIYSRDLNNHARISRKLWSK